MPNSVNKVYAYLKLLKTLTIGEMHLMKKIKIRPNLEFKQKKY